LLVVLWLSNIDGFVVVDEGVITFDKRLERGVDCDVFNSVTVGRDGKILVSTVIEFDSEGFVLSFIIVVLLFIDYLFNVIFCSLHFTKNKKKRKKRKMDCIVLCKKRVWRGDE